MFCPFFLGWRLIAVSVWQVLPPAAHKPTDAEFFIRNGKGDRMPNASYLKEHFFQEGRILGEHALWIIRTATAILKMESNMVLVSNPVTGAPFVEFLVFGS